MPGGRPTIFEDDEKRPEKERRLPKLFRALELGLSHRKACAYAGISYSTFKEHYQGEDAEDEFSAQVNAREAHGLVHHAEKLENAGGFEPGVGGPVIQAAKFFLSTHDREAFREQQKIEHALPADFAAAVAAVAGGIDKAMREEAGG